MATLLFKRVPRQQCIRIVSTPQQSEFDDEEAPRLDDWEKLQRRMLESSTCHNPTFEENPTITWHRLCGEERSMFGRHASSGLVTIVSKGPFA